ncbi:hypothetical protein SNE40_001081 [Patella caerulea]|uniref:Uncharacterized protein n=1 Tax=Patella caerulea TaxID=87958 RepID=A0AAN8KDQ3_PATCE
MSKKDIDQGWAWVVLVAAATSLGLCSMATASIGIFQAEFLESFDGTRSYITLVCSIHSGLQLFLGPVASIICNAFSIRVGAMFGSMVFSLGLVLSSLSSTFEELLLFFGVIAGSGFGIMYTSVSVITSHYFHEKRLLACGITFASPGLGYLAGPSLTRYLITNVGLRSTLGIIGCLVSQVCVLGALFFPIDEKHKNVCKSVCQRNKKTVKIRKDDRAVGVPLTRDFSPKRIHELKSESHLEIPKYIKSDEHQQNKNNNMTISNSEYSNYNDSNESLSYPTVPNSLPVGVNSPMLSAHKPFSRKGFNTSLSSVNSRNIHERYITVKDGVSISKPDGRFITSIQTLSPLSHGHRHVSGSLIWESHWSMQHVGNYLAEADDAEEFGILPEESAKSTCKPDFSVLKNKALWCLSVSQFFLICGYGINFIHFPSMIVANGIDISVVPQLYMTQGVALIIARLMGGLFASHPDINILLVSFGCQVLLGTIVFCVPFLGTNIWAYHLYVIFFAMYYGGTYVVLTQIVIKILGLQHLATGFGLQMMMAGTSFFITPALGGWLYDITESYAFAYHFAGAVIFGGAFFVLMIQAIDPGAFMDEPPEDIVIGVEDITIEKQE